MSAETETAKRYRRHAEQIRTIAQGRSQEQTRQALLNVARDYERMADTLLAIDKTNQTLRMRNSA
jgi:hypothetical protein